MRTLGNVGIFGAIRRLIGLVLRPSVQGFARAFGRLFVFRRRRGRLGGGGLRERVGELYFPTASPFAVSMAITIYAQPQDEQGIQAYRRAIELASLLVKEGRKDYRRECKAAVRRLTTRRTGALLRLRVRTFSRGPFSKGFVCNFPATEYTTGFRRGDPRSAKSGRYAFVVNNALTRRGRENIAERANRKWDDSRKRRGKYILEVAYATATQAQRRAYD